MLRSAAVEALFGRATEPEQRLLRGLVFDEIRQGALDSLVQDGLAEAYGVPAKAVQRAAMLLGSTASAAIVLARSGLAGLEEIGLAVGVPVRPMLAASAPDPTAAIGKTGLPAVVDHKLDGIRVQVHRAGDVDQHLHPQPGRHHRQTAGDRRRGGRAAPAAIGARW